MGWKEGGEGGLAAIFYFYYRCMYSQQPTSQPSQPCRLSAENLELTDLRHDANMRTDEHLSAAQVSDIGLNSFLAVTAD